MINLVHSSVKIYNFLPMYVIIIDQLQILMSSKKDRISRVIDDFLIDGLKMIN